MYQDHPRRCGAFYLEPYWWLLRSGSSPQVRGICSASYPHFFLGRIIPAGAGHLIVTMVIIRKRWDHPRRCGAFSPDGSLIEYECGSSPQMRGISSRPTPGAAILRIIPADAGHLGLVFRVVKVFGDHTRRCGAFYSYQYDNQTFRGSSPQMRGILPACVVLNGFLRIIPADAGHFC